MAKNKSKSLSKNKVVAKKGSLRNRVKKTLSKLLPAAETDNKKTSSKEERSAMAAKKEVVAKKPADKKSSSKKAAAKKVVAKKVVAKKVVAKKVVAKKTVAKKTVAKKVVAKKVVAKKVVAKKVVAKKVVAKKVVAKKVVAKKVVAKKAVAKKPSATATVQAPKKKPANKKSSQKRVVAQALTKAPPAKQKASKKASPSLKPKSSSMVVPPPISDALIHGVAPYKPKKREEYMGDDQYDHFRKILSNWRLELMEEVDETVSHLQDESLNLPDPADRASQEEEFSLELRTRDRERKLIKKIEKTLEKIESGDYGFCDTCGVEVGLRRLEARPTADQCIDCKELSEIKERQLVG